MPGKLSIAVEPVAGSPVIQLIRVEGFLDAANFREFTARAQPLTQGDHPRIVVDLAKLEYLGSAGVAALMDVVYTSQDHDGEVALAGPTPKIREVLRTLGLADLIPVKPTVEEAVDQLRSGSASPVAESRAATEAASTPFGSRSVEFVRGGAPEARPAQGVVVEAGGAAAMIPPSAPVASPPESGASAKAAPDASAAQPADSAPKMNAEMAELLAAQRELISKVGAYLDESRRGAEAIARAVERVNEVLSRLSH